MKSTPLALAAALSVTPLRFAAAAETPSSTSPWFFAAGLGVENSSLNGPMTSAGVYGWFGPALRVSPRLSTSVELHMSNGWATGDAIPGVVGTASALLLLRYDMAFDDSLGWGMAAGGGATYLWRQLEDEPNDIWLDAIGGNILFRGQVYFRNPNASLVPSLFFDDGLLIFENGTIFRFSAGVGLMWR